MALKNTEQKKTVFGKKRMGVAKKHRNKRDDTKAYKGQGR